MPVSNSHENEDLTSSANNRTTKLSEDEHVFLMVKDKPKFQKVNGIKCITSDAEYSWVYTDQNEKYLVRKLLKNWEEILPESSFIRIHRSTIVNLNFVSKVDKWYNNSYVVCLKNMEENFVISRRYTSSLKHRLKY